MSHIIDEVPRFALYGILGTYNYGTESIVRGTVIALRSIWPNCVISYVSPVPDEDRMRLKGCDLDIVPRRFASRGTYKWFTSAVLRRFGLGWVYPPESLEWISHSDCILSIGGDLYTLPPASTFSSNQRFFSPHLLDVGGKILHSKKMLVIWGASIGPFEAWPSATMQFRDHLSKVPLITVREPLTVEYLASLDIRDNVRIVADPAFLTPALSFHFQRKSPRLPLLGVNLSPHSVNYAAGNSALDLAIQSQAEMLVRLALHHNVELVLLPHVISDDVMDDDRQYLQRIFECIFPMIPDRVSIILDDPGAQKMKGLLQQCDAVIAARMHCGVHAVSVGTPVLFLAYSAKARGMSRYVYDGDDSLCVTIDHLQESSTWDSIEMLLRSREILRDRLIKKQARFAQDATRAATYIRELMTGEKASI